MSNECTYLIFQPCPYCEYGENDIVVIERCTGDDGNERYGYQIRCDHCKTTGPWEEKIADAIRAWNRLPR